MTTDDREQPDRATNTAILNQVGQPPPVSVLGTVLAATGGAAPRYVVAVPEWGDGETTWLVLGCTDRTVFKVTASKSVNDWYGSHNAHGELERVTCEVVPLSRIVRATFELEDMQGTQFGNTVVVGSWTFDYADGGTLPLPSSTYLRTDYGRDELAGIVDVLLSALA